MIRQQADRIRNLEKTLGFKNSGYETINLTPMPEPVAWMLADKENEYIRSIMAVKHDFVPQGCVEIPLYTTPQTKPLSDEEIWVLSEEFIREKQNILLFARAIEERHKIK